MWRPFFSQDRNLGTSLVVQWLEHHVSRQGAWVLSLIGELRPSKLKALLKQYNK